MSLNIKSPYFSPIIFKGENWIFYNEKSKCHFQNGNVEFTVPIEKACSCVFIDKNAFVVNEDGNIYKIDLNTRASSCIIAQLGTDTYIYKTFDNKLFISVKRDYFYRIGYLLDNDKLERVKDVPANCKEIWEYNGDMFFLVSEKTCAFLYKRQNGSENLICCFNTKHCNNTINLDFDFENSRVVYYDNVKKYIKVFDYSEKLINKLKFRKTVNSFGLIDKGKYIIIATPNEIQIIDSIALTALDTLIFDNETYCFYPSVDFNYADKFFCISLENEVILYEICD